MYISVMICDDLEEERAALARMVRQYCQRCALELRLDVASSGEELLDRWTLGQWDLVFLDIFMDGMTGVETARSLRQRGEECAMVFATTSQEHGMEGFDLQVMDYLLKPFDQGQLERTMDWFVQQTADRLRLLRVDMEGEELTIRVGDIDYVEMYRHTAAIHAGGRVYGLRRTMDALEDELKDSRFFRCHRSYLVNLDRVQALQQRDFVMENGQRVPISLKSFGEARRRLQEWMLAKNWGR